MVYTRLFKANGSEYIIIAKVLTGKVFLLLTLNEFQMVLEKPEDLSSFEIYKSENVIIYGFENYNQAKEILG